MKERLQPFPCHSPRLLSFAILRAVPLLCAPYSTIWLPGTGYPYLHYTVCSLLFLSRDSRASAIRKWSNRRGTWRIWGRMGDCAVCSFTGEQACRTDASGLFFMHSPGERDSSWSCATGGARNAFSPPATPKTKLLFSRLQASYLLSFPQAKLADSFTSCDISSGISVS